MKIVPEERHSIKFSLPNDLEPTVATLSELFLTDDFIESVVENTNKYGKSKRQDFKPVTASEILMWFSIIYYMGVVRLPAKEDHWASDGLWPKSTATAHMSHFRFKTIWKYIHLTPPQGGEDGESDDEDEDGNGDPQPDDRWYAKAATLFDLLNRLSKKYCKFPGFALAIDEMMKRFKGRSYQTFRMKGKPVKEGYKFWAICDSACGYVYHCLPACQIGQANEEGRGIVDSVLLLLDKLLLRGE